MDAFLRRELDKIVKASSKKDVQLRDAVDTVIGVWCVACSRCVTAPTARVLATPADPNCYAFLRRMSAGRCTHPAVCRHRVATLPRWM
jgi:hypothetical protein